MDGPGWAHRALIPCFKAARRARLFLVMNTPPSLNVDLDPGGYLEDLGAILEVLGPMVITV